jgi:hypothetical protein
MNNHPEFCLRIAWQAALCALIVGFASITAFGAPPDARKIMEDVYRQNTSRSTFMRASFEVFDKQGHVAKKEFTYRRIGSPPYSKTLVVFTAPERFAASRSCRSTGAE